MELNTKVIKYDPENHLASQLLATTEAGETFRSFLSEVVRRQNVLQWASVCGSNENVTPWKGVDDDTGTS